MKVYVIESGKWIMNPPYEHEDWEQSIDKIFTTYRGASDFLLQQDFEPYPEQIETINNWELEFVKNQDKLDALYAWITEHNVINE